LPVSSSWSRSSARRHECDPHGLFLKPSLARFSFSLVDLEGWLGERLLEMIEAEQKGGPIPAARKIRPMEMVVGAGRSSAALAQVEALGGVRRDRRIESSAFLPAQPRPTPLDGNLFPGRDSSPSLDRDGADSENAVKRNDVSH
jgi:hypothetical protein